MIERIEYRAQMARMRLSHAELARRSSLSKNVVRAFLSGGDIRLSSLFAITQALGGDIDVTFQKVADGVEGPSEAERMIDEA